MRESYKQRCLKAEAQLAEYQRKLAEARQIIDWLKQLLRGGATEPQGDLISRDALLKDVEAAKQESLASSPKRYFTAGEVIRCIHKALAVKGEQQ